VHSQSNSALTLKNSFPVAGMAKEAQQNGPLQHGGWVYVDYVLISSMIIVTLYILFWA